MVHLLEVEITRYDKTYELEEVFKLILWEQKIHRYALSKTNFFIIPFQ